MDPIEKMQLPKAGEIVHNRNFTGAVMRWFTIRKPGRPNESNPLIFSKAMTKYKLEYIWLDGNRPVPELRGKTAIKQYEAAPTLADIPN